MAGAALAWGAPSQEQCSRSIHCRENSNRLCCQNHSRATQHWSASGHWLTPAKAHPGGWMEIPCSASLTLKPQNISWQQGDKEKTDRDSVFDGRKYTQALGSFIRTNFTSTSLHQRQVPLPAHSCHPTLASLLLKTLTYSAPLLWSGDLRLFQVWIIPLPWVPLHLSHSTT